VARAASCKEGRSLFLFDPLADGFVGEQPHPTGADAPISATPEQRIKSRREMRSKNMVSCLLVIQDEFACC